MKTKILLLACTFFITGLNAQVTWQKMASLPGSGRDHAIAFSHGTNGYVMTGENGNSQYKDFWEYNSLTDTWAQLPNYTGPVRSYGVGYVYNDKAYIGFGHTTGGVFLTDWWQYDFNTSTWTQKNNFPGAGRDHPCCAMVNGMIYMGFGDNSSGSIRDWWQYDPALDSWTQKTNYPGLKMHHPVTAQYNNLIYLSQGHLASGGSVGFYSYNTTNDTWTTLANMPGPGVVAGASFYIGNNKVYSGAGITEPANAFHQEFYAYDITGATWSQIANYPGNGVFGPVSFVIGNEGYVATGQDVSGTDVKDLYKLFVQLPLDAGINSITTPNGTMCSTTFLPAVSLHNYGSTTLTSCTINYRVDANPNQTYAWSGSLASGASTTVALPSVTTTAGTHTFTSSTSSPNGGSDGNAGNDQTQSVFSSSALPLPLVEGFEGSANIPPGWSLYNPNSDAAWQVSTTVAKTGTNSVGFNNCNGDGNTDMTGRKDRLITPSYNFVGAQSAQLSFDVAYAPLYYQSVLYGDTLAVYSSIDCGATWVRIYYKGGTTLASAPQVTSVSSCWSPTSSNWRNDAISLSGLTGQPNVMFAFEDISMWGEWIYLDNINITSVMDIKDAGNFENSIVSPNPATNEVTIGLAKECINCTLEILNGLGQSLRSEKLGSRENRINITDLSSGVYYLKIKGDNKPAYLKKLVVQ